MPLDNIKTRMQSTGAEARYRNSLDCFLKASRPHCFREAKLTLVADYQGRRCTSIMGRNCAPISEAHGSPSLHRDRQSLLNYFVDERRNRVCSLRAFDSCNDCITVLTLLSNLNQTRGAFTIEYRGRPHVEAICHIVCMH